MNFKEPVLSATDPSFENKVKKNLVNFAVIQNGGRVLKGLIFIFGILANWTEKESS